MGWPGVACRLLGKGLQNRASQPALALLCHCCLRLLGWCHLHLRDIESPKAPLPKSLMLPCALFRHQGNVRQRLLHNDRKSSSAL
eukprot:2806330-Amphidinium_carterae.1